MTCEKNIFSVIICEEGKQKRNRSANFSHEEELLLQQFAHEYRPIVENNKTDAKNNKAKNVAWAQITERFNSVADTVRTYNVVIFALSPS